MKFTIEQKIQLLEIHGYAVKKETYEYEEEYYRNLPEKIQMEVYQVYDSTGKIPYKFEKYKQATRQLDELFNKIVTTGIINLLKSVKK